MVMTEYRHSDSSKPTIASNSLITNPRKVDASFNSIGNTPPDA